MKITEALKLYTNPRTQTLLKAFQSRFPGEEEVYIAHAPGRVNLIGEHIDYNGYGVMPMAVDKEIEICFVPSKDTEVEIYDAVKDDAERKFHISGNIEPFKMGDWGNYIKAPCQEIFNWAKDRFEDKIPLKGFKAVLIGDVPPAAGLSSSSAIVVCVGVVVSFINRLVMTKETLAGLMAQAELYVGTMGGGMDQSASIFGHTKGPLRIAFKPIRVDQITMPDGYSFIIANSMRKAKKTGEARFNFNSRSITCKLGVEILKNISKKDYPDVVLAPSLRRLQKMIGWDNIDYYFDKIPMGGLSINEICELSGLPIQEISEKYINLGNGEYLPIPKDGFPVYDRISHVFNEAKRVSATKQAMLNGDMGLVGKLMDESHASCRDLYEISCPELEKLIDCLKNAGTMGSRLTGAGWGGCTVSLVKKEDAQRIINEVWETYYMDYASKVEGLLEIPSKENMNKVIFECVPAEGAGIRKLNDSF